MRCPNCDGPVTGEDQHLRYKPGVEPNAEWFCSAPSSEALRAERDRLRARVASLESLLRRVTIEEMGGVPDLFGPQSGWEQFDDEVMDALRAKAGR